MRNESIRPAEDVPRDIARTTLELESGRLGNAPIVVEDGRLALGDELAPEAAQ